MQHGALESAACSTCALTAPCPAGTYPDGAKAALRPIAAHYLPSAPPAAERQAFHQGSI
jgi:hypothetical protein